MTFYEAALRVLEDARAPLHFQEITKRSMDKGLLSHVGKAPEVTMLSRLAAMAKRPRDRRVMVTQRDTFALTDWMLPEDPDALAQTGLPEPRPEESLLPLRSAERHPEPRDEYLRTIGRQADRRRRDDDKRKKHPPLAEVAFEALGESGPLPAESLLERLKANSLAADDAALAGLIDALADDNQRRLDQGRRPQFVATRGADGRLQVSLELPSEVPPTPLDIQAAFCAAAGLPFENGRVARSARTAAATTEASSDDSGLAQAAKSSVREARRAMARVLRRRLADLEHGTFEKACVKLLHAHHFRELKVARRSKDGPLLTARKRDGSLELRFAIRVLRSGHPVERRHVQELRRELGHHGCHLALLLSAGEARGDARSEATSGPLAMLWCGDGLAEKFFEAHLAVRVTSIELYDLDEHFFTGVQREAEDAHRRREERHRERDQRSTLAESGDAAGFSGGSEPETAAPTGAPSSELSGAATRAEPSADEDEGNESGPEGPEDDAEPAEGSAGADSNASSDPNRRRRRRRRRRRGRGRPEMPATAAGARGAAGAGSPDAAGSTGDAAGPGVSQSTAAPPPPAPEGDDSGGG